jgi:hypothetical protein
MHVNNKWFKKMGINLWVGMECIWFQGIFLYQIFFIHDKKFAKKLRKLLVSKLRKQCKTYPVGKLNAKPTVNYFWECYMVESFVPYWNCILSIINTWLINNYGLKLRELEL